MSSELTEYSGVLRRIGRDFIVIDTRHVVGIPEKQLDKYRRSLCRNKKVGILVFDGGEIRIKQDGEQTCT